MANGQPQAGVQPDETVLDTSVTSTAGVTNPYGATRDGQVAAPGIPPEPGAGISPDPGIEVRTTRQPSYFGISGEQTMAFALGLQGWEVVVGPGGEGGKSAFAKGIDILAMRITAGELELLIGDNKASGSPTQVTECSALVENLLPNLVTLRAKVGAQAEFPSRVEVLGRLDALVNVIKSGGGQIPSGVKFQIMNAGGFSDGVSPELQRTFFAATGLTDGGKPVQFGFEYITSQVEVAGYKKYINTVMSGQNPRSYQGTTVTTWQDLGNAVTRPTAEGALFGYHPEPERIVVERVTETLGTRFNRNVDPQNFALVTLEIFQWLMRTLVATFAEPAIVEAWERIEPKIVEELKAHPGGGVLIVVNEWVMIEHPRAKGDNAFYYAPWDRPRMLKNLEVYGAMSPDEAYAEFAGPTYRPLVPGMFESHSFHWIDGHGTRLWKPQPLP